MSNGLKVGVGLVALLLAFLGVRWMFVPQGIAAEMGITLAGPLAFNTVRGDLGGMFIAGTILCVLALRSGEGRWLQAVALVIGCVATGRFIGLLVDGFATMAAISIVVEVVMVATLLAASQQLSVQGSQFKVQR